MVKRIKGPTWKPVELEGALFNSGVDGLIGLEECIDYDLNTILLNKKSRKRKAESVNGQRESSQSKKSKKRLKSSANLLNQSSGNLVSSQSTPQEKNTKKQEAKDCIKASVEPDFCEFSPSKRGSTDRDISTSSKTIDQKQNDSNKSEGVEEAMDVQDLHMWNCYGLPKSLLQAIKEQGFDSPTPIQALTLPSAVLGRRDILGAAETGSGKTLAFGLPILAGILKIKEKNQNIENSKSNDSVESDAEDEKVEECDGIEDVFDENLQGTGCVRVVDNVQFDKPVYKKPLYALVLTPTRELAIQVKNHLIAAAKYTGIRVAVVLGGMAVVKQERVLSKGPEIVVATPGRLWELIQEGNAHLSQIDNIRFLAIDETDRMIEKGHFKELHHLLERINTDENKRKLRQNFVFSATLTLVHELPSHLAVKKKMKGRGSRKIANMTPQQKLQRIIDTLGINNPKVVDVTQKSGTAGTLSECRITCAIEEKDYYVYYFVQRHPGRTLIFCNSIGCVKRLTTLLGLLGCSPLALHASMQQRQRLKNLDRFRDNENAILIATDVAARGLDIPCVEHVLHYQTPRTSEGYVHRSGRTARATRQGITVLLVEPSELQNYLRLCRTLGRTQDLPLFPVHENMLNSVKQRIKLARDLDKLELQVRKANSESGWIQKASEEMDILIDDDASLKYNMKEARGFKKAAELKRKQLAHLLNQPVFPTGFSGKYPLAYGEPGVPLELAEQKNEKALDVLKNSVENYMKTCRKKAKWLFKPKVWENRKSSEVKDTTNMVDKKVKKKRIRNKSKMGKVNSEDVKG